MAESKELSSMDYSDILHLHCTECFSVTCTKQQNCKITKCPAGCGMSCHGCKIEDHLVICAMVLRPCYNALYGCPYKITTLQVAKHLDVCPAGAVHCGMQWNRYPVYSLARRSWMPFTEENPPKIKGHLDIELAFNDQRKLKAESYDRMRRGKMKISCYDSRKQVDKKRIKLLEYQIGSLNINDLEQIVNQEKCDSCDLNMIGPDREHERLLLDSSESNEDDSQSYDRPASENAVFEEQNSLQNDETIAEMTYTANAQEMVYESANKAMVIENTKYQITGCPKMNTEYLQSPYLTRHLGVNVTIETLPKFQTNHSMYSIPCQTFLRRDQYCSHFKNVHNDIHGGLNTWLQQRCPLAQYGCPFIQYRFKPGRQEGCLVFDQDIGGFAVRPEETLKNTQDGDACSFLMTLPFEVMERIVEYLDSFSIIQFSKTCKRSRDACRSLVRRRGVVLIAWKRGTFADGSVSWKPCKMRWLFTPSFSDIREWRFTDEASIGNHLRTCSFFKRAIKTEKCKFPFDGIQDVKLGYKEWRR
eukprot:gene16804-18500_t